MVVPVVPILAGALTIVITDLVISLGATNVVSANVVGTLWERIRRRSSTKKSTDPADDGDDDQVRLGVVFDSLRHVYLGSTIMYSTA